MRKKRHPVARCVVALATLLMMILCQETWTLAGVTGNLSGTIKDSSGAPIAGVQVQAVAPSESRTATTDASGHFIILSLAPDTYTVNLTSTGYQSVSFPGVTIFADQTQSVAYTMVKTLKTIARVTSQAGASLVKSGVGSDLYSVNAAQASAAKALGGGGNLNNAYSAMASVPGVQTSAGGMGWEFNAAYVRGQNSYYTGFEYDGIPVNRAFDNYNASTESSLGLQELQVYTGGGPSSVATAGTAGFINQVIKTGTFPGFADANLGIGTPTYYHQAQVEIGGSTPDRTFSYYIGLLGYNQAYNFLDTNNAAGYMTPGGIYSGPVAIGLGIGYIATTPNAQGVKPSCPIGAGPTNVVRNSATQFFEGAGCWEYYSGLDAFPQTISDRENVINLHMGIPKRNGLRDDVQLMWSGSALNNYFYQSPADIGSSPNQFSWALYHQPLGPAVCGPTVLAGWANLSATACAPAANTAYAGYPDNVLYNTRFGATVASSPTNFKAPGIYYAPDTPAHEFNAPIPLNDNNVNPLTNDTGITKIQYTYALSQSAYLRAYGYTFYSDWLQTSPIFGSTEESVGSVPSAQYDLITHTAGGALEFSDQLNDQNLLGLDGNYSTAGVVRFNNGSAYANCLNACIGGSPIGYMAANGKGGYTCYNPATGKPVPCLATSGTYWDTSAGTSGKGAAVAPTWTSSAQAGPACPVTTMGCVGGFSAPGTPAALAGAAWDSLWNGNATGSYNTVKPKFTNASLSDQWRPSDKFLLNGSIRYDNFTYGLPDSLTAADAFYAQMSANYTCVQASTNQLLTAPQPPGSTPPAPAQYVVGDCNQAVKQLHSSGPQTGWVHPNGTVQDGVTAPNFTASSPSSYSLDYWQPRFSATYTMSPDTVLRASAGRFTQPPISASVQYLSLTGDDRTIWNNAMNLGFYSPFHPIPGISSAQYDLSLEHHFTGTDISMKLTPFYTWVTGWQQQTFIGAGFVTQIPVGVNRDYGAEFQLNKGDFTRNGLSGQLSFTYTNSKVQFQNEGLSTGGVVPNALNPLNQAIAAYNVLTKAGGGSECYQAGQPASCTAKPIKCPNQFGITVQCDPISNPYYNQPAQPLLDANGWYNPWSTAIAPSALNSALQTYISPYVSSLILNYRKDKLAITPSFVFQAGGYYGGPLDITGVDPRSCTYNSLHSGITKLSPKTNPLQCNYLDATSPGTGILGYLYIPDPQTGFFASPGQFQNPSLIVGNLQLSYDVSPRIKLTLLGANLFHACFGGSSEPWTAAYPPGGAVCGYDGAGSPLNSTVYPSNFYNGTSMFDKKANNGFSPLYTQSYYPLGAGNSGAIGGLPPPLSVYFNASVKI